MKSLWFVRVLKPMTLSQTLHFSYIFCLSIIIMENAHKRIIQHTWCTLINTVAEPSRLIDELMQRQILTRSMANRILQSTSVKEDQMRTLLDILMRRGPNAFHHFQESLLACGETQALDGLLSVMSDQENSQETRSSVVEPPPAYDELFLKCMNFGTGCDAYLVTPTYKPYCDKCFQRIVGNHQEERQSRDTSYERRRLKTSICCQMFGKRK